MHMPTLTLHSLYGEPHQRNKNYTKENRADELHRRCREVILVPQELVVFNDTTNNVQKRLIFELSGDGMYPCPTICQPQQRNGKDLQLTW